MMEPAPDELPARNRAEATSTSTSWARSVMWIGIVCVMVGGTVVLFRACLATPGNTINQTGEAVTRVGAALRDVVSAFRQGKVTTSFISYATTIEGVQHLQIGKLKQMELFTRSDERMIGYIALPEVVIEARAPIEYTYYVDLHGAWRFVLENNVIEVYAPELKFNTPSVDVSKLQFETKQGRFGADKVREDLQKSIGFLSKEKARQNIPLIRETGRRQVGEFVQTWLSKQFPGATNFPVRVVFADETGRPGGFPTNAIPRLE